MNNHTSERRIRNNHLRRKRQLRHHIGISILTVLMIAGLSGGFFSVKAAAQSGDADISYKYYKSITIASGDTLWNYAKEYADLSYYTSYEDYIQEVKNINHLKNDSLTYGKSIIVPYFSHEFTE
jgi:hypothetical protein